MHSAGRERTVRLRPHTSAGVIPSPAAPWVSGAARTVSQASRLRRPVTSEGVSGLLGRSRLHARNGHDPGLSDKDSLPEFVTQHANECACEASSLFFESQGVDLRPQNAFGRKEPTSLSPADRGEIEQGSWGERVGRAGPSAYTRSDEVKSLLAANESLQRRLLAAESRHAVAAAEAKNAAHRSVSGEIQYLVAENEDLRRQLGHTQQELLGKPRTLMYWKVSKGFASLQDQDRMAALEKELELVQPALRKAVRDRDHLHAQLQETLQRCTDLTSELFERRAQVSHLRAQEKAREQEEAREQESSKIAELKSKVASLEQELELTKRELHSIKRLPQREEGAPPDDGGQAMESVPSD